MRAIIFVKTQHLKHLLTKFHSQCHLICRSFVGRLMKDELETMWEMAAVVAGR